MIDKILHGIGVIFSTLLTIVLVVGVIGIIYDSYKQNITEPFYSIGDKVTVSNKLEGVIINKGSSFMPTYKVKFDDGATSWYVKTKLKERL